MMTPVRTPGDIQRRVQILRVQAARSDQKIRDVRLAAKQTDMRADGAPEALASIPRH